MSEIIPSRYICLFYRNYLQKLLILQSWVVLFDRYDKLLQQPNTYCETNNRKSDGIMFFSKHEKGIHFLKGRFCDRGTTVEKESQDILFRTGKVPMF